MHSEAVSTMKHRCSAQPPPSVPAHLQLCGGSRACGRRCKLKRAGRGARLLRLLRHRREAKRVLLGSGVGGRRALREHGAGRYGGKRRGRHAGGRARRAGRQTQQRRPQAEQR